MNAVPDRALLQGTAPRFGQAACALSALAARALGWRPGEFWAATPAELALSLADPAAPDAAPLTRADFDRLLKGDRDGHG